MKLQYLVAKIIKKIQLPAIKNSRLDSTVKVGSNSQINECSIEKYSYVGNFTNINHAQLGKFCSIASNCEIGGGSHPWNWISTSPVFTSGRNIMKKNFSEIEFQPYEKTIIGNDVWIGTGALIKGGVKISDGAVIGMGAVVTKDVGAYEIWGGNPARLIRKRFEEETIKKLLELKWWDWDENIIKNEAWKFNDPVSFLGDDSK